MTKVVTIDEPTNDKKMSETQEETEESFVKIDSDDFFHEKQLFLQCQNLLHLQALHGHNEKHTQEKNWSHENNVWVLCPGSENDICL